MSNVDYTKHRDTRVNNPTMENRNFMVAEERAPVYTLYPRDPSLDPQLVWKGKDQQDREDLAVPAVPIYIQEKILPAAIIEEVRKSPRSSSSSSSTAANDEQPVLDLFSDFNGIDSFEKEIEFYQHEKNWTNRMVLGDSLLVMNSLAEKEGLKGKVQCIYIDPPYGIKFGSNWQVSTRKRNVKDGRAEDAAREPEVIRAFRDTWKLGIHSYLSYLRDRFTVASELLTKTGSLFVQIGDSNVHLVRSMLDEVFGSEMFVSEILIQKTAGQDQDYLDNTCDYIVWYAKSLEDMKYRQVYLEKRLGDRGAGLSHYKRVERPDGTRTDLSSAIRENDVSDPSALPSGYRLYRLEDITSRGSGGDTVFPFKWLGRDHLPALGRHWRTHSEGMARLVTANRVERLGNIPQYARFIDDFDRIQLSNLWTDVSTGGYGDRKKQYVVETNPKIVARCLLMVTDPGDLVLDPTCGSGTTAAAAEEWGRRWITIDTSRVALALTRTRLMVGRFPYYLLADSAEGVKKESELSGQVPPSFATGGDVKKGFVYERVPHVTLKSIANNPDIHEGMTREEIDKAIDRHAETEYLYDKPYQDPKRVRVTGPFTVESLSPHRILPTDERPASETTAQRDDAANDFVTMVLENLRKAGVQNTKKGERLVFEDLQPHAGRWIQGVGSYRDGKDERDVRVAVSVGPEFGTVGPEQVKEAAKEALQGIGHDVLVVCGYAFDPHVSEEAKHYGSLVVLPTKINADLQMADELLKKTGAGNLFMVFGEPDLTVSTDSDGKLVVEIRGVDVYDPTTGEIRSSSTDDIACWFIDTNYDGESFFVRHAYFTGADEPYEKLKRALRAEIDEAAWSSLYSTKSRPFERPSSGRIAVKVINHYGDEVLKVYDA